MTPLSWSTLPGDLPLLVDLGGAPGSEGSRAARCIAGTRQIPKMHLRATTPNLGGGEASEGRPDPEGGATAPTGRRRGGNRISISECGLLVRFCEKKESAA